MPGVYILYVYACRFHPVVLMAWRKTCLDLFMYRLHVSIHLNMCRFPTSLSLCLRVPCICHLERAWAHMWYNGYTFWTRNSPPASVFCMYIIMCCSCCCCAMNYRFACFFIIIIGQNVAWIVYTYLGMLCLHFICAGGHTHLFFLPSLNFQNYILKWVFR